MLPIEQHPVAKWLSRHFRYAAMDGSFATVIGNGVPLTFPAQCRSLHRWTLVEVLNCKMYLHCWEGDDWSLDLHDHSSRMISIGLWGQYHEITPQGTHTYRAPWIRTFAATHRHRVTLVNKQPCWTLVLAWPRTKPSAFYVNGLPILASLYKRSSLARKHRAC